MAENDLSRKYIIYSLTNRYKEGLSFDGLTLQNIDLSKLNFYNCTFIQTNLIGANLQKTILKHANLMKADLQYADLQEAVLSSAELEYTNLQKANLQKANLENAFLVSADLEGANLIDAKLWNSNLQRASFITANMRDANLWKADLQGADLRSASLITATLQKANLWEADLQNANLWKANLQEANLRKAKLKGTNLEEADLQKAKLKSADLQEAKLKGTNLQDADLRETNLQKANLQGANLTSADLRSANLWEADLQNANLRKANLQEADLRKTKLKGANLEEADLRGVYSSLTDLQETSSKQKQKHKTNIEITQGKKLWFQLWIWKDIRIKQNKNAIIIKEVKVKEINENTESNIKDKIPFDIHPQIENLIDMALLDGKISEEEKEIILRQAKNLGLDEDELEILLDVLLSLHQQAESKKQATNINISEEEIESIFLKRREEEYSNEIKECPNCGTKNSSTFCSSCGFELSGEKNSNVLQELLEGIQSYEGNYIHKKTEEKKWSNIMYIANYWSAGALSLMSGGMFVKSVSNESGYTSLQRLLIFAGATILVGVAAFLLTSVPPAKERDNFIDTFPIPDTKTDLFEMIILAKSQILPVNLFQYLFTRAGKKQKQLNKVWSKKLKQIVNKGKSLQKQNTNIEETQEETQEEINENNETKIKLK